MAIIKIILTICLVLVFIQDIKERLVYWFLFPTIGILSGLLFYKSTLPELFYTAVKMNTGFILILILVIFLYSKFKLKTRFFNAIGLGDLLLFFALSVSFATISFIIIFTSALIFSLTLHLILLKKQKTISVPLAGYICLFFSVTYLTHWSGYINILYTI